MRFKLVAGIALLVLANHARAETFFLTCKMVFEIDGTSLTADFKIDEANHMVDNHPAVFTEKSISYKSQGTDVEFFTVFSRVSGHVTVSTNGKVVSQGECAIRKARKF